MKFMITVAACLISAISFSAVAQEASDQPSDKWGALRLAQNKCTAIIVTLPSHKISRDELDNKLPKNIKWNPNCVALLVGIYNRDLDDIAAKLHSPKCDPTITQSYIESQIRGAKRMYDELVKEFAFQKSGSVAILRNVGDLVAIR